MAISWETDGHFVYKFAYSFVFGSSFFGAAAFAGSMRSLTVSIAWPTSPRNAFTISAVTASALLPKLLRT